MQGTMRGLFSALLVAPLLLHTNAFLAPSPLQSPPPALRSRIAMQERGAAEAPAFSRRGLLGIGFAGAAGAAWGGVKEVRAEEEERMSNSVFYAKWPYSKPSAILPYIYATAKKGDVDSILAAMDGFGERYPMYKLGDEKGKILEEEILKLPEAPMRCVELGTFLGYSALRTARHLAPGGKLVCVEFNPEHAQVAEAVVEYAGLSSSIEITVGDSSLMLDAVKTALGGQRADFVLLDHRKSVYLPDLKGLEERGVVGKGTMVAADNVIYPGTPDYLEYVDDAAGRYNTRLRAAKFEYDQFWRAGWTPKADAVSFSVRR
mmetsp:Transcript_37461/g.88707  ORF Transcript_37461/g.88707 Transcript_37461/m.88707 type:complete len:318 (+) Transcript_37461:1-954(+)